MAERSVTTYEEAKKCPRCGRAGEVRGSRPAPNLPRGTKIESVYCVTELCSWYNTMWFIQVNPDGTIPPPRDHTHSKKHYEGFEDHDEIAKNVIAGLRAQQQAETDPEGAEIRRRGGQ